MLVIRSGDTDLSVAVYAVDELTGLPKKGITAAEAAGRYARARVASVAVAPVALGSPEEAHVDGGFIEIDAEGCPGWYRFDVPDAALAAGAAFVVVVLQSAGALISPLRIQLVDATPADLREELHLCKAALVNRRVHIISTGVDEIKDDDGETTLLTMTPTDGGDDVIVVEPA
jgi:hypothetical protein